MSHVDPSLWALVIAPTLVAAGVAYHDGPTHGEALSHCELHDVATGHRLASWDGDLSSANRPTWTAHLGH